MIEEWSSDAPCQKRDSELGKCIPWGATVYLLLLECMSLFVRLLTTVFTIIFPKTDFVWKRCKLKRHIKQHFF